MRRWSTIPPPAGVLLATISLAPSLASAGCGGEADDPEPAPMSHVSIPPPPAAPDELTPVGREELCVEAGRVDGRDAALSVSSGGMRAVVAGDVSHVAEIAFTYEGTSDRIELLANGELRRQIGLKLRARDTCNVVYVMWHVEPTPGVFVSVKRNDGLTTHDECGAAGYLNVEPIHGRAPAPVRVGERHTLRAELEGTKLRVFADGVIVWDGDLPEASLVFDGPSGVRSDNGRFDFELRLPGRANRGGPCRF